ncbi:hypothetical protein QR680_015860 [Steinernema hermaphroditum]|uniref:7TM GPCR serpentine receptor class x (Srx) domain-containing protein n=1 Tax=Steinernema hermaphroditum TaxID=289476 RepID=A0AA39HA90_9BILA|nr:hypothetical protein QR680_015860 [Steinernema hermaphroditum]
MNQVVVSGVVYCCLGFLPLPLYIRIISLLFYRREYRKQQCYVLLGIIGTSDCILCFGMGLFGILVATGYGFGRFTEYVAIPILATAWQSMIALNVPLALNRLIILCNLHISDKMVLLFVVLSCIYSSVYLVCHSVRFAPLTVYDNVFQYDAAVPFADFMKQFEFYSSLSIMGINFVIYVFIVGYLSFRKSQFSVQSRVISKRERKLLVQTIVIFVCGAFVETAYCKGEHFLPDSSWSTCFIIAFCIFTSGWVNPGLLLICNRF